MAKPSVKSQPTREQPGQRVENPWLSAVLLVAAYTTYGGFLHSIHASLLTWALSISAVMLLTALCTIGWQTCRRFILLGFESDLGYVIMALTLASLSVVAVTNFRLFSYLSLLVAVTLLTRVDMLIAKFSTRKTWLCMTLLVLLGLGLAWGLHSLGASTHLVPEE